MLEDLVSILEPYGGAGSAVGGLIAIVLLIWGILKWPFQRNRPTDLSPETIEKIAAPKAKDGPALTTAEFIRIRRELKADLEAELAQAADAEKAQLTARIAELESQIANPDEALAAANRRIADLEALLEREGNEIAPDRIAEARTALEAGDFSLADDLFAEIEARAEMEVQRAARAAFGRGEVAEQEVRWADAAGHYARAARLSPTYASLYKASRFAERSGDYSAAAGHSGALLSLAQAENNQERLSTALNEHALNTRKLGRFEQAEGLYREALEIDRATIGEGHPSYATRLNNLAGVVEAQGRFEEAEGLYRQAQEITRATMGEGHPSYAIRLNNLALVVQAQGRFEEAEGLYREALKIDRATIGEGHPGYAINLNNLAGVVEAQGRFEEAEGLYLEALEIGRATIGEWHPEYAVRLGNLGQLLGQQGKAADAREMLQQGMEIFRATLPPDHPYIAEVQRRIDALPPDED